MGQKKSIFTESVGTAYMSTTCKIQERSYEKKYCFLQKYIILTILLEEVVVNQGLIFASFHLHDCHLRTKYMQ